MLLCINATPKEDCHKYYLELLYKTHFKTLGYAEYGCLLSFKKMFHIRTGGFVCLVFLIWSVCANAVS